MLISIKSYIFFRIFEPIWSCVVMEHCCVLLYLNILDSVLVVVRYWWCYCCYSIISTNFFGVFQNVHAYLCNSQQKTVIKLLIIIGSFICDHKKPISFQKCKVTSASERNQFLVKLPKTQSNYIIDNNFQSARSTTYIGF